MFFENAASEKRADGFVAAVELPVGNIVQQRRELDDRHVGVGIARQALGHSPHPVNVPPIMSRTLTGEPCADLVGDG